MATIDPHSVQNRPGSVTIVQWLGYLQGALSILGGVLFLALRNDVEIERHFSSTQVTIVAVLAILFGLVTWWVSTLYAGGSRVALVLVAGITLLHTGSAIYWLFLHPGHVVVGSLQLVLAVVIFYLAVLNDETRRYFDEFGY